MEEPSYCNLSLGMNCTLSLGSTTSRTDIPARLSRAGSPNQNLAWSISVHSDREVPSLDKSDQDVSWGGSSDPDGSPEYYPKVSESQGRFSDGGRKSFKAWTKSSSRSYKDGAEISQALFGMVRNPSYSNRSSPQPWVPSNLPSSAVAEGNTAASKVERCMQEGDRHVHMCAHCGTSKTPLWRNGPGGPKSLCNACGIRFKKAGRRSAANGNPEEPSSLPAAPNFAKRKQAAVSRDPHGWVLSPDAKPRKRSRGSLLRAPDNLMFDSCVPWQPCRLAGSPKRSPASSLAGDHENKLNLQFGSYSSDEEEGAVLLMALSCGVVDA